MATTMNKDQDYYSLLGLDFETCTAKDISKAYRKVALKYHPDKNKDPKAVDIFHALSKAYEVLQDPKAKAAYDKACFFLFYTIFTLVLVTFVKS